MLRVALFMGMGEEWGDTTTLHAWIPTDEIPLL